MKKMSLTLLPDKPIVRLGISYLIATALSIGFLSVVNKEMMTAGFKMIVEVSAFFGWLFVPFMIVILWLVVLSIMNISMIIQSRHLPRKYIRHLSIISWLTLMFGLLGTVSGLISATSGIDISQGIDDTIKNLNRSLGEALYTTFLGVLLSVIAKLQVYFSPDQQE